MLLPEASFTWDVLNGPWRCSVSSTQQCPCIGKSKWKPRGMSYSCGITLAVSKYRHWHLNFSINILSYGTAHPIFYHSALKGFLMYHHTKKSLYTSFQDAFLWRCASHVLHMCIEIGYNNLVLYKDSFLLCPPLSLCFSLNGSSISGVVTKLI